MRSRVTVMTVGLAAVLLALCAGLLWAAPYTKIIWEGEDVAKLPGKVFSVKKKVEDPSGKVSGNKVLAVPKLDPGEKVVREDIVYTVKVPADGRYYLWARTFWTTGCGNSFFVKVQGYDSGEWIIGGDGTYNILHWVCLSDTGDNKSRPRPLILKKGTVAITFGSRESGTMLDQVVLTTDPGFQPAGIYKATANALVK
ncbi:MAG TPA: hypothetical protein PLZ36_18150 [Armatimonadota bacterium]|nr:hypothetical protein [Armatimonadota bacterium]HOS42122.1 hypothetical protein [Armatimonadota bacterium]